MVNDTPRPLYPRGRPGTKSTEVLIDAGPVWTDAENLIRTGIRSRKRINYKITVNLLNPTGFVQEHD